MALTWPGPNLDVPGRSLNRSCHLVALGQSCWPTSHEDLDGDIWGGPAPWHRLFSYTGRLGPHWHSLAFPLSPWNTHPGGELTQALNPGSCQGCSGCSKTFGGQLHQFVPAKCHLQTPSTSCGCSGPDAARSSGSGETKLDLCSTRHVPMCAAPRPAHGGMGHLAAGWPEAK